MILIDANVLIHAFRKDSVDHAAYRDWLARAMASDEPYGLAGIVLASFLRIVTHHRVYRLITPIDVALRFVADISVEPNCLLVAPGPRHWEIFARLCRNLNAGGNLIPDAYLAAIAIENGAELITTDRNFARFAGLRWRQPLR